MEAHSQVKQLTDNMCKGRFSAFLIFGWLAIALPGRGDDASATGAAPAVPDAIKVPATDTLSFSVHAKGFQIYECQAKKEDATQYEWVFKAPEADLFDAQGKKIGRHYAGPTWESTDGSKVVGEPKGRAPSTDAAAVPWLLLGAKTHEGDGVFSRVSSIQRVETVGGKAPAGGCDQASPGKELRVPYTAVYYFYVPKP